MTTAIAKWRAAPVVALALAHGQVMLPAQAEQNITASASPPPTTVDERTGATSWHYEGNGLGIELVQVAPDYIRASYAARGLPDSVIEEVAGYCVFGTIIRNISDQPLHYRVADWRYTDAEGTEGRPRTKSEWLEKWHGMGVRFSWSILADDPTFAVGDWVQGFTTLAEPHGSRVNLKITWSTGGQRHETWLSDMQCAPASADHD